MIQGYHVILPHYGFWLPNDPRGSWSYFVASWELARFGKTTRHLEQRTLSQLTGEELAQRDAMRAALLYPPVTLTGRQKNQAMKFGPVRYCPSTRTLSSRDIATK